LTKKKKVAKKKKVNKQQKSLIVIEKSQPISVNNTITRSNYELDISRLAPGNFLIRLGSGTEAGCAHFIKK
jgi:hypothetical protein